MRRAAHSRGVRFMVQHCDALWHVPGVIVVAKSRIALQRLQARSDEQGPHTVWLSCMSQASFAARSVVKSYLALCSGDPTRTRSEDRPCRSPGLLLTCSYRLQVLVEEPIGRHRGDKKKMAVVPVQQGGRHARPRPLQGRKPSQIAGGVCRSTFRWLAGDAAQSAVHVALDTGLPLCT